jgi:hypothetical protein
VEPPSYPQVHGLYEVALTYKYQNLDGDPPTWTNGYLCLAGFRIPSQGGGQFSGTFFENSTETGHCRLTTRSVSGSISVDGFISFSVEDIAPGMTGCAVIGPIAPFWGEFREERLFAYRVLRISCVAGSALSVVYGAGRPVPNAVLYQEIWGGRGPL